MSLQKRCFYAYAAKPEATATFISNAIRDINSMSIDAQITDWRSIATGSRLILDRVCRSIDESDLFICDLTTRNSNVLFELGYAIARKKPVWVTLHPQHYDFAKHYDRLPQITTIVYVTFENEHELKNKFLTDRPFARIDQPLIDSYQDALTGGELKYDLFYLKSPNTSNFSRRLTTEIARTSFQVVVDDPMESSGQTLSWYLEQVSRSVGVLAHISERITDTGMSEDERPIYPLVCGIAYGFGKPLRMLASAPHITPIDFRELAAVCDSEDDFVRAFNTWSQTVRETKENATSQRIQRHQYHVASNRLNRIDLGHFLAENEEIDLSRYFIETPAFREAIDSNHYTLFVGRKGTGKTANLYQIANSIREEHNHNFVCIIKPVDYQFESIFHLVQLSNSIAGKKYVIESLWKFLIYTELAVSIYEDIKGRPIHHMKTESEDNLFRYIDENERLLKADFAERMETAIRDICEIDVFDNSSEQRQTISEMLHERILTQLRQLLGAILTTKNRVFILVDNLDKGWQVRPDLDTLADFLFGLFGANEKITRDFQNAGFRRNSVKLSLVVFIRSDIFSYVEKRARERDKLPKKGINWNEPRLLGRIIEERFAVSLNEEFRPDQIWGEFFPQRINNIPTREFIFGQIIPRPRDIIIFCRVALKSAQSNRQSTIIEDDIRVAQNEYSYHVFSTLVTEVAPTFNNIEDFLLKFAGVKEIISHSEITRFAINADIDEERHQELIDLLCDNLFLGLETSPDIFEFFYDESKIPVLKSKADKLFEHPIQNKRYKINLPFHKFLDIQTKG